MNQVEDENVQNVVGKGERALGGDVEGRLVGEGGGGGGGVEVAEEAHGVGRDSGLMLLLLICFITPTLIPIL